MCHHKSWLRKCQLQGSRWKVWNHQLLVSQKIVVGEVLSCEDVPETHLHVCQVNVGEEEARQIVCGAPNVRAGIKVMVLFQVLALRTTTRSKKGKSVA